ncbi:MULTISPECIES: hypothetical protein [Methanocalculus]|uniref:hypothetical protein n=1 Tax=Methanocalculus TaxID=71151 RepID=UPI00209D38FA|nr:MULTISPECIES: hypothetical protein [unclassified Methanocalculus]MCP1662512.1 hypothetical protein [Methanocalculus sp. AMF5]
MSKIVLVDEATGKPIRHPLRTLKEADEQREWYERMTGRKFRVVKVFRSGIGAERIDRK